MRRPAALVLPLVLVTTATTVTPATAASAPSSGRGDAYIVNSPRPGSFPLVAGGKAATLVVSASDHPGVVRVVNDLQADIERVTGVKPAVSVDRVPSRGPVVLIGTIGQSPLIDGMVSAGKLDVSGIAGNWETSLEQVVGRAFVIAGSDQRGTIYGVYETSKQIGVSPWYWWDDVPAHRQGALYVLPGRHTQGTPAVKYRGFFINDENPNLGTWAPQFFGPGLAPGFPGGFNSKFYAKVFETLLRLKGNYLWPAVWGRAFALDDPQNHATATAYGVVMGTSHEAPMMRGIEEWNRAPNAYGGTGEWSFRRNEEAVKAYWRDGIRRMRQQGIEGVVTLGMRGNGDVSLPDGDGVDLMQNIIAAERQILAEEGMAGVPQVFTLYKEVQRYWDRGLRPPDDVTVVFTDDNWGNMRKLPALSDPPRAGGYGMYYHFDYVGGARNYKWVDTINLANTWEQLSTAYQYGVDRLWVANVGDMKNEEMPLQLFLDYAWDPFGVDKLDDWERRYAAQNFGPAHASAIASVLHDYGVLQARRKPELLNRRATGLEYNDQESPYYLENYREHARVTGEWQRLAARADAIRRALPPSYQDAYFQLVHYQVKATANLYALRLAEFTNLRYAAQGRAATNDYADLTDTRFAEDQALNAYYNTVLAGGKWKDFQLQPKIGYGDKARYGPNASWQQPELNNVALPDQVFPAVQRIDVPAGAELGVAIDGSDQWWPGSSSPAVLPAFSPYQSQPAQYIEVFNRGSTPFDYTITPSVPWVSVRPASGRVDKEVRATVHVDWSRAPKGTTTVPIAVSGAGRTVEVQATVDNRPRWARGFVEANGYVSIPADDYSRVTGSWRRIPDIGRTGDGMTPSPVTAPSQTPGGASPRLEYTMDVTTTGPVTVWAYLSPRNPALPGDGLRYAVSVDDAAPQIVNITTATGANDTTMNRPWEVNTSDNVNRTATTHTITTPGKHTLKFWMVDPTVILQHLVVDTGGLRPSYLGPPASRNIEPR